MARSSCQSGSNHQHWYVHTWTDVPGMMTKVRVEGHDKGPELCGKVNGLDWLACQLCHVQNDLKQHNKCMSRTMLQSCSQ